MSTIEEEFGVIYLASKFRLVSGGIFMSQSCYIVQCLNLFGLADSQSVTTPMIERLMLMIDLSKEEVDFTLYRKHVGKLI